MRTTDENLQMLLNPRALKLNDILKILDALISSLDESIKFDRKNLIDAFRDIPTLNRYIHLSDVEFAKSMLSLIHVSGENVDENLKEIFIYDNETKELEIPFTTVLAAIETSKDEFNAKIVDFSKLDPNDLSSHNKYARCNTIAYDFITKMQSKLWNGILDTYINDYMDTDNINLYSVQKYDEDLIYSIMLFPQESDINIYFFKENVINWALAHGLIVVEKDVDVIHDKSSHQVIITLDFNI